jgi:ABC-2 type transport system permease protein
MTATDSRPVAAPPADPSAASAVWIVARREITERARDRSFAVSTVTTVVLILGIILVPRLLGFDGTTRYEIGVVGETADLGAAVIATGAAFGSEVELARFDDVAAAEAAVTAGEVEVALLPTAGGGGVELVSETAPGPTLRALLDATWRARSQQEAAAAAGLDAQQAAAVLDPPPLGTRTLQGESREDLVGVAFVGMFILYGQLFGYGVWIAMGIVEEKSTRVVEVLLSALRPRQLLAGKILGIGVLALGQLLLIAGIGLAAVAATGVVELPPGTFAQLGQVVLWFVLGFSFYACMFAMAGALVSRQEEVQNVMTPLTMLILVSFFSAFAALNDPGGLIARTASFIPFSAPLTMPLRVAAGQAAGWEVALSIACIVVASLALVPLAARVYQGAILRTGARVRLADAWRGAQR